MWFWLKFICSLFELILEVNNLDYYKDISDKVFNEDMLDVVQLYTNESIIGNIKDCSGIKNESSRLFRSIPIEMRIIVLSKKMVMILLRI